MSRACLLLLLLCPALSAAAEFRAIDVYLQTTAPVAAWQFELHDANDGLQVVGVENGASAAFGDAPYFDEDAVAEGRARRIIVADFSLAEPDELPSGRFRIATVHLMIENAAADLQLDLVTATDVDGVPIEASISLAFTEESND